MYILLFLPNDPWNICFNSWFIFVGKKLSAQRTLYSVDCVWWMDKAIQSLHINEAHRTECKLQQYWIESWWFWLLLLELFGLDTTDTTHHKVYPSHLTHSSAAPWRTYSVHAQHTTARAAFQPAILQKHLTVSYKTITYIISVQINPMCTNSHIMNSVRVELMF